MKSSLDGRRGRGVGKITMATIMLPPGGDGKEKGQEQPTSRD